MFDHFPFKRHPKPKTKDDVQSGEPVVLRREKSSPSHLSEHHSPGLAIRRTMSSLTELGRVAGDARRKIASVAIPHPHRRRPHRLSTSSQEDGASPPRQRTSAVAIQSAMTNSLHYLHEEGYMYYTDPTNPRQHYERVWVVLHGRELTLYHSCMTLRETALVSVPDIQGYDIEPFQEDEMHGFKMIHFWDLSKNKPDLWFLTDDRNIRDCWIMAMFHATKKRKRSRVIQGLNLEGDLEVEITGDEDDTPSSACRNSSYSPSFGFRRRSCSPKRETSRDATRRHLSSSSLAFSMLDKERETLLREMLSTKQALEAKKRATAALKSGTFYSTMADIANRYERAHTVAEEDSLRRQVILRQRKISANLKINNLEKQIKHQKTRPSTISEATEEQISNLNTTVKDLDAQLHETQLSRMDVAKEIDQQRVSEIQALQQLGALQDETPKKKSLEELGMPSHIAQPKMKPPSRAKSTKVRHSWNPSAINSTLLGQLAVSNPEIYSNGLLTPAFEQARECEKLGKRTHSECLKIDADLEHEIQLFTRLAQGYFKKIGRDDSFEEFLSMIKDPTCSESQMI